MKGLPETLEMGLRRSQIPGLDGLRAIAAFLVVFYHFGLPGVSGGIGVLIFFVLSGFLITWLLLKEIDRSGTVSLRDFYARRSLRIFPAFYCYAALALVMLALTHRPILWPQAIAALLYVNNYYQAIHGHITSAFSHTWSLGIEEQFYLLWPAVLIGALTGKPAGYRRAAAILCASILAFWIYRGILVARDVSQVYRYEAFDARADNLLAGCLLAVLLRAGIAPRLWSWLCTRSWRALPVVGLLALSNFAELAYGPGYRDTIGDIAEPLLTAIFIAQIIAMAGTRLWGWLNARWIVYLGRISYSIYLYQAIVMGEPKRLLSAYPVAAQLAVCITMVILAASCSYFFIERPFLRLKRRFASASAAPAAKTRALAFQAESSN